MCVLSTGILVLSGFNTWLSDLSESMAVCPGVLGGRPQDGKSGNYVNRQNGFQRAADERKNPVWSRAAAAAAR